ncbi:hypothetical protein [Bradyrhizobium sp. BR 1432]|uniref:hypothetical protein n=1 Tax=Bradyrhizobium sp. BR 1432 TaxID=3447966 RepID=UPI003EE70C59
MILLRLHPGPAERLMSLRQPSRRVGEGAGGVAGFAKGGAKARLDGEAATSPPCIAKPRRRSAASSRSSARG